MLTSRSAPTSAGLSQKNGSIVRKLVGHERLEGLVAAETLGRLYRFARLYVNFFQPSFKLLKKIRVNGKVRRIYRSPATPFDRLLESGHLSAVAMEQLRKEKDRLDPIELLHQVRKAQEDLATQGSPPLSAPGFDEFLNSLPRLWREGEARPTHRKKPTSPRTWRTRADPFEGVWMEVLGWLESNPDAIAKDLLEKLQVNHPGTFGPAQLRTLQRRVQAWRSSVAHALVFGHRASATPIDPDGQLPRGERDQDQSADR